MSIPKDTTIEDKVISDEIMSAMQLSEWEKLKDFGYGIVPNKVIVNIDDEYIFWIDKWDENYEICKLETRHGGKDRDNWSI